MLLLLNLYVAIIREFMIHQMSLVIDHSPYNQIVVGHFDIDTDIWGNKKDASIPLVVVAGE